MLVAMADESGFGGEGKQDNFFSMCAYVGHHDEWSKLSDRWRKVLKKHNAPYLHMREFAHRVESFKGWTEAQRRGLLGELLMVIQAAEMYAVGAVLRVADFETLPEEAKAGLIGPYMVCFQELVFGLGLESSFIFPGDKVDFVYSRQDEFSSKMRSLWQFSKSYRSYGTSLGVLDFQEMKDVPGLQAADLLAYELRHLYHRRDTKPGEGPRFPMRKIFEHQEVLHAKRLKYLPAWLLRVQADGSLDATMRAYDYDLEAFGEMVDQMNPGFSSLLRDARMMALLEKYKPFDSSGLNHVPKAIRDMVKRL
jgi:hypothetical protein